jgi:hypothetical protein
MGVESAVHKGRVGQVKEVSHEKGVERERRTHEDTTEEKVSHERVLKAGTPLSRPRHMGDPFPMKKGVESCISTAHPPPDFGHGFP